MTSEIPPDFDKPWSMSDVVIRTNNSDGKKIHAYKGILAMYSPYFRVLFFGDFKEKNDASVNVDCDYDVMIEILRNLHQIGFKYAVAQEPYSSDMLVKMYRAADIYDFALIRNLCMNHIDEYCSIEMAKAADELELHDLRMKIWMRLTPSDVNKYLRPPNSGCFLNKEEFLCIFKKVAGFALPLGYSYLREPLHLSQITESIKNPRVNLNKPWRTADLMIIAGNSKGRVLYANMAVVEMMCLNLDKYLCATNDLQKEGQEMFLARIDAEYTAMKEILSMIHVCNTDCSKERTLHPALLHAMYLAGDENHLDIPMIRKFCVDKLLRCLLQSESFQIHVENAESEVSFGAP